MRKPPEDIWCENGVYYDYEHDGGVKYVRADRMEPLIDALNTICRLGVEDESLNVARAALSELQRD